MEAVISTLAGGALAIAGTLVGTYAGRRSERERWRRDLQIQLSRDALSSFQQLMRATIDLAYSDLRPRAAGGTDTPPQAALRSRFEAVITDWNAAMYGVLVGGDVDLGTMVRELDRQADDLTTAAWQKQWDRIEFREERRRVGEAMARYVDTARERTGLPPLRLTTVWTWADEPPAEGDGGDGAPGRRVGT